MVKRVLSAIVLLVLICPALAGCAPDTVVIYTDLRKADVEKLIAPYVESAGVTVQIVTFGSADSLAGAVAPDRGRGNGGGPDATPTPNPNPPDIVLTQDIAAMAELAGRGALVSYMPPSVSALPPPYGANGGGYWYGFGGRGWVLAWNTDLVKKPPESYADLADDDYPMNSVTMPNLQQFYFYPLSVYSLMGADYAMNIFQTLMTNGASFTNTPEAAVGSVAAGQAQLAVTTYALARQKKDAGEPVDFAFPDQGQTEMGAYVQFYTVGVGASSRHAKAAKSLDNWLMSAEAEKRSVEIGLSDVTLRDVGGDAPVVKPLVVSPQEVLSSAQAAEAALRRLYEGN
jgi:ABC-type Fe3+ transport system substrate-binding protein